ncbi:hypothetical protein FDP41_008229 [Naegleria fowleri]|uniref:Zn(2)-C6 fungal-type domain-containing protein n=1 Tax=Naegleria fowleri TaxID=5763 RepID=A0A6A5BIG8_NAEFO|nr:uncharacterized protein FDP41_008229 [Naegleria fowleri]KAF0973525.1 hypothetical protein FDP41_008229 [Naegleria fowleri]CAG4719715.1 unnamed protein product [Naegleria fowleri]
MTRGENRRGKVGRACHWCRKAHLRCDMKRPCERCTKKGLECIEATDQPLPKPAKNTAGTASSGRKRKQNPTDASEKASNHHTQSSSSSSTRKKRNTQPLKAKPIVPQVANLLPDIPKEGQACLQDKYYYNLDRYQQLLEEKMSKIAKFCYLDDNYEKVEIECKK